MRSNMVSTEYTGNVELPANQNRSYFLIVMNSGTADVTFGEGTGGVPVSGSTIFEPRIAPISKITITSTGTYTVVEG